MEQIVRCTETEDSGSEQEGEQMRLQCASPSCCKAPCGNIQNMSRHK